VSDDKILKCVCHFADFNFLANLCSYKFVVLKEH